MYQKNKVLPVKQVGWQDDLRNHCDVSKQTDDITFSRHSRAGSDMKNQIIVMMHDACMYVCMCVFAMVDWCDFAANILRQDSAS